MEIHIFIFRRDLRLDDNLALNALIKSVGGKSIYPMFIFNPKQIFARNNAYHSNNAVQFMIESLEDLEKQVHINYFEDDDIKVLKDLMKKYKIKTVSFNKDYTPFAIKRDEKIMQWCKKHDIDIIVEEDYTLFKMGTIVNGTMKPYQVFTPFYKRCMKLKSKIDKPFKMKAFDTIKDIRQFNKRKYFVENQNIMVHGGRKEGLNRLKNRVQKYSKQRDYPALDSTTKLSAYIKFGCVSIREVYWNYSGNKALQRELLWREFYANIMYHFPHIIGNSFKKKYDGIRWTNNKTWFKAWCEGKTGYALVDAGMRQLNNTGWMHNRVRMIVAMFLTKDLLIDWRWGERYFATKLVDYDPASNNGGWQWSASTGTDAQPYFRIFNPNLQIKKWDKDYEYIRRWNPDYKLIRPIVDHQERVNIAIKVFKKVV